MKELTGKGWRRPGMSSYDYGQSDHHNHDRRNFSNISYTGKGPKGFRRSHQLILEEASEILKWDPEVDASEIEVHVEDQCIYLRGSVDSRHAKRRAEYVLDNVQGVQDVQNQLRIKPCLDLNSDKTISRGDNGLYSEETIPR